MHQIEHYELASACAVGVRLRAGCVVRVSHGWLWLTRAGDAQDVWLQAGDSWTQPATGRVWLSAEPSAQFQLANPLRPWPALAPLRRLLPTWRHSSIWPRQPVQAS
jgi:hypothetical protein